jgi:hypothetical protein
VIPALVSLSLKAEFPEDVRNSLRDKGVGSPNCTICELLDLCFLSDSEKHGRVLCGNFVPVPTWATSVNQARALVFEAKSHFGQVIRGIGKEQQESGCETC